MLTTLQKAIANIEDMTPDEFSQLVTPGEVSRVLKHGLWDARRAFGTACERGVARDVAVLADPNIRHLGNAMNGHSVPDFWITGKLASVPFDVTASTDYSIGKHLDYWLVAGKNQLLTYAAPGVSFLESLFPGI